MTDQIVSSEAEEGRGGSRRRWLLGAVAGTAALAGVGLAWHRHQAITESSAVDSAFWQMEFAQPDGGQFGMASLRGKPILLNFWATWCPPCVEELPLLSRFYQENAPKGWQVLGLAVDQSEPVRRFLAKTPVTFPVALAGLPGVELSRSLGNLMGALPFTVVLGADGQVVHRKMGKIVAGDLQRWALQQSV